MVSVAVLAQALPSTSSGVDWLYQFTNNLTNLTTQNGGALTQLGLTELACISLFVLIGMVVQWNTSSMTFRLHHEHLHVGDLVNFLLRLTAPGSNRLTWRSGSTIWNKRSSPPPTFLSRSVSR